MEYHEAANFLFDLGRYSPQPGVESTRQLLSELSNPHESYDSIQIAGSNGKGSTARMVEQILREAGYSVGVFTSPHLDDLRERVRINGRPVTKATVCRFVESIQSYVTTEAAQGTSPTFFETTTALALWAFAEANVDFAVLEVGIGGRYDATSVVDPVASAVTSVTIEHADILGDTIEEIARDKAAVSPVDHSLVTAATGDALAAIEDEVGPVRTVGDESADVVVTDYGRDGLEQRLKISIGGVSLEAQIPLLGGHQVRNAGVAVTLASQIISVDPEIFARGLRKAHLPGRFEIMEQNPLVIIDGAHNPGGCESVSETLDSFDYDDMHLVFGAMSDKDHAGMVAALPTASSVYTCRPQFERAETAEVLATVFEQDDSAVADSSDIQALPSVEDAVESALATAETDDIVLILGSLFVVAEARRYWTQVHVPTRMPDLKSATAILERADVPPETIRRVRGTGVHRVFTTKLRRPQARTVQYLIQDAGGTCAISGIEETERDLVSVVLNASLETYQEVLPELAAETGLGKLAANLSEMLGLEADTVSHSWGEPPAIMGVLNVTPDSFHDGGQYELISDAVERAEEMIAAGADIIDIGGESTRPGANPVSIETECNRILPVIEAVREMDVTISVDTRKARVAEAALEAGATMLNDVSGLEDPAMRFLAADYDVPLIIMHSIETPVNPDRDVAYDDVVSDTLEALLDRVLLAEQAGLDRSQIIIDPGLGFGKSAVESFELLGRIDEFSALRCPVLIGHSHKSMFELIDRGPEDRLAATVAASALAADRGVDIIRVHDVDETVAAVDTVAATNDPSTFLDSK